MKLKKPLIPETIESMSFDELYNAYIDEDDD